MDFVNSGNKVGNIVEDYPRILDRIMGGVILCDFDSSTKTSRVVYINRGWTEITGYTAQELEDEQDGNPQALVFQEDKAMVDAQYEQQMQQSNTYELMYRIVHRSGAVRWVIDKGMVTPWLGGVQNQSIITEVITIKESEEYLRQMAQTDMLTKLKNKVTFMLLAQSVLQRQKEKCHALLLLDIDRFKVVNDSYGHACGDQVLEAVALEMKKHFRSRDILGRVGGDEFMVLMADIPDAETAEIKAHILRQAIAGIRISSMDPVAITVSIGMSISPIQGTAYETLFTQADNALYQVKAKGRNGCMFYTLDAPSTEHMGK